MARRAQPVHRGAHGTAPVRRPAVGGGLRSGEPRLPRRLVGPHRRGAGALHRGRHPGVGAARSARDGGPPGLDVRQTRRLRPEDLAPTGIPRVRPEVAGVRAALWARSDKQASLLLTMAVQQGLTTAERLGAQALTVKRDRRRILSRRSSPTCSVGYGRWASTSSPAESPQARHPRAQPAGRPQVGPTDAGTSMSAGSSGAWSWSWTASSTSGRPTSCPTPSATTPSRWSRSVVLRLPLLGLRVAPDEFFAQIVAALVSRGCPLVVAS